jgi:branched-chain amino acid transport system substrate-binding protein
MLKRIGAILLAIVATGVLANGAAAQSGEPIKIGFSMALTGPLAANGKQALVGMKIWEEEINAKGGLLGRPVKLVYYDDQSNPSTVPGIYTKLLDVDKVDVVVGPYATNMMAPSMPVVMQKGKAYLTLFGLDVNHEFQYPKYFSMDGFFQIAAAQNPKPTTVGLVAADAEFSNNACEGARANAKKYGFKITYDKTYPPSTTDFTPVVRAIQAANPDVVVVCSYPLDSVGMLKAVNEVGYKPKMIGGAMVGLQATAFKNQLGPLLNGVVNYETWVPDKKMTFAGTDDFFKKYQARAAAEGVDPLGYYLGGWGYADLQIIGDAIAATKGVNDDKLADYLSKSTFHTIMGDIKFGKGGEWEKGRMLQVQYHDIKPGAGLDTWRGMDYQIVLTPSDYKTGDLIYPYEKAKM